jgi:hypothetical protein
VATGLTNDTPYTFTVSATNARGTSADSPASDAVAPGLKADTTTTLVRTQPDVLVGRIITLRGTVTGVTGAQTVVVRSHYRSSTVDTTYSAPDGHFALDVVATQNVTFQLLYLGDSAHNPSSSATSGTIVHGLVSIGTITRTAHRVAITGLVRPVASGQSVLLYEVRNGQLSGLQRVLTGPNGRFSLSQAASRGRHVYRMVGAASPISGITNAVQVVVNIA